VHAFDILGDPVRRRILEILGDRRLVDGAPLSAGTIAELVGNEFGISQPAVSQHLKVLRESGFASCTVDGQRRLYAIDDAPLREVDMWLDRYRRFWTQRLAALDTEVRRGTRASRPNAAETLDSTDAPPNPEPPNPERQGAPS
jgi:DNA-binding transcriptional ArsR family regulator